MTFMEELQDKCKFESIEIIRFNDNEQMNIIELELKYLYSSYQIPKKFQITRIEFTNKILKGFVNYNDWEIFISSFYV